MEVRALLSRPELLLLFALLCGVRCSGPCEWARAHLGYDPKAFNCTGLGLAIRPSDTSTHTPALELSFSGLAGIRRSDFLPRFPSMANMNLSHSCIVEVQEAAFAGFWDLEVLDLSGNCLRIIRDGTLKGLGRLKTLDLRHNRLSEVHRYAFTGLDAVQRVWLQNNKLDTIPEAISGLADLRVLSMANNQISWVDSRSFHGCRSLAALHLQNNRISRVSVDAFKDLTKLQMLNLGSNLLEMMPGSTLESLWCRGTDIRLHGNPWRCDCSLAELRGEAPTWLTGRVQCHGGATHGVPLSSLALGQLVCQRTLRVSQTLTATVMEGTGLRIPCGNASEGGEAQYWHTPFGRLESTSVQGGGEPVAVLRDGGVKITRATPHHTGLYYCLRAAAEDRVIHPYWVECQLSATSSGARPRKTREAEGHQETVSAGHFAAAVTGAVLLAFLAGFPAGAFSRTYLSRGFQRLRRRPRRGSGGVDMATLPRQRGNGALQRGRGPEDTPSSGATHSAGGLQGVQRKDSAPYLEGSDSGGEEAQSGGAEGSGGTREARGKQGGGSAEESAPYLEGSDSGGEEAQIGRAAGSGGMQGGRSAEETDPSSERGARPSKRRVIKVYNYDEEGNRYGHIRDAEDEGAANTKQRTQSLTRLNAIMTGATSPAFSKDPSPGGREEDPPW